MTVKKQLEELHASFARIYGDGESIRRPPRVRCGLPSRSSRLETRALRFPRGQRSRVSLDRLQ